MKYAIILFAFFFSSCLHDNEVIFETKNNGTDQKAVLALSPAVFTAGDIYYVFILGKYNSINGNDWGRIFIIDNWDSVLPKDTSNIRIRWLNGDTLKISYNSKLRIYNQVVKTRDNTIVYEKMPELSPKQ